MKVTVKIGKSIVRRRMPLSGSVYDPSNAREVNVLCAFDGEGRNLGHFSPRVVEHIKEGEEVDIAENWANMSDSARTARLHIYGGITIKCPHCKRDL